LIFGKKKDVNLLHLLTQSAENTLNAAQVFRQAMEASEPASYVRQLRDMEKGGDNITRQILRELDKVFVTPLDRADIITLATKIDDVMDGIEATIARFDYLHVTHTDDFMKQFADVLVKSCEHMLSAFKLLEQKKFTQIRAHTVEINELENEADRLMREGIRIIFTNPKDPYHDFRLKEIYERLEETTDSCEDVADILDSVLLRYT
jgi:hypothetical protein